MLSVKINCHVQVVEERVWFTGFSPNKQNFIWLKPIHILINLPRPEGRGKRRSIRENCSRKLFALFHTVEKQNQMKKIYTIGHCTTSLALFEETGLDKLMGKEFILQNIKFEKITPAQLDEMKKMAGTYEALFSRRAIKYKEWKLKDKQLTEKGYRQYILDEYTFLKRPVVIIEDKIFVGSEKKTVAAIKRELQ